MRTEDVRVSTAHTHTGVYGPEGSEMMPYLITRICAPKGSEGGRSRHMRSEGVRIRPLEELAKRRVPSEAFSQNDTGTYVATGRGFSGAHAHP